MYFNLFSSCRLLFNARLPLSQLSSRGFDPIEKLDGKITRYECRIDVLDKTLDGLSDKQDQHWQDLHKEKLLLLKALEQLREKELLLARLERAVLIAVRHDGFGKDRSEAGDVVRIPRHVATCSTRMWPVIP